MIDPADRQIFIGDVRKIRVMTGLDFTGITASNVTVSAVLPDASIVSPFGNTYVLVDDVSGQMTFDSIAAQIAQQGRYLIQIKTVNPGGNQEIQHTPLFDFFVDQRLT